MKTTLSKLFYFSASYSKEDKVFGHNYILEATAEISDEPSEIFFENAIRESLIKKLESRDLGLHVDFLKEVELTEQNILKAFWEVIQKSITPLSLVSLSLQRDKQTKRTLSA